MVSSLGRCLEENTFTVLPKPTMWTSGGRFPSRPPMLGIHGTSSCSPSPLLPASTSHNCRSGSKEIAKHSLHTAPVAPCQHIPTSRVLMTAI